jgi:L-2,4-diaminobutyric acid acetyltransferase
LTELTHQSKAAPPSVATQFSPLTPLDGPALHRLIGVCTPLDTNSLYCNLLQSSHFAATSITAKTDGVLIGSITGYRIPERPNTLFIWQVAVHPLARGQGMAIRMLRALMARPSLADIQFIETTITEDNSASWRLFLKFADECSAETQRSIMFEKAQHFDGHHDSEQLLRIGPFSGNSFAHTNLGDLVHENI